MPKAVIPFVPKARRNYIICKRITPETFENSFIAMPEKYRKMGEHRNWVEVVSVSQYNRESLIRPGFKVWIGNNMGVPFIGDDGIDYVAVFDKEPLLVDDGE
jgi:hypothetical protein